MCRDALDSPAIASVAYALLDALVVQSSRAQSPAMLDLLLQPARLSAIVATLNDADLAATLRPDARTLLVWQACGKKKKVDSRWGPLTLAGANARGPALRRGAAASLDRLTVHEARLSLLLRLAQTPAGARALVAAGLFGMLSKCHYIDLRPDDYAAAAAVVNDAIPSASTRYHHMIMPVLRLIDAVVAELHTSDRQVLVQAAEFFAARRDWALAMLRDRLPTVTVPTLEQLKVLTGILAQVATADRGSGPATAATVQWRPALLGLLGKYGAPRQWLPRLRPTTPAEEARQQVAANVAAGGKLDARARVAEPT